MKPKKITPAMLRKKDACPEQVEIFAREWPTGAAVTLKNCLRAVELNLDIEWCTCLLPKPASDVYYTAIKSASDAYDTATKSASDAYYTAIKPASDAYDTAIASAFYRAWRAAK